MTVAALHWTRNHYDILLQEHWTSRWCVGARCKVTRCEYQTLATRQHVVHVTASNLHYRHCAFVPPFSKLLVCTCTLLLCHTAVPFRHLVNLYPLKALPFYTVSCHVIVSVPSDRNIHVLGEVSCSWETENKTVLAEVHLAQDLALAQGTFVGW